MLWAWCFFFQTLHLWWPFGGKLSSTPWISSFPVSASPFWQFWCSICHPTQEKRFVEISPFCIISFTKTSLKLSRWLCAFRSCCHWPSFSCCWPKSFPPRPSPFLCWENTSCSPWSSSLYPSVSPWECSTFISGSILGKLLPFITKFFKSTTPDTRNHCPISWNVLWSFLFLGLTLSLWCKIGLICIQLIIRWQIACKWSKLFK